MRMAGSIPHDRIYIALAQREECSTYRPGPGLNEERGPAGPRSLNLFGRHPLRGSPAGRRL